MVFVGVHPLLMQVPPRELFSMSATCHPMSAKRKESGTPACPEPITIASYFMYEGLAFVQPFKGGNSLREPGLGPCSARLQAGICSNLQCRLKADATKSFHALIATRPTLT